MKNILYNLIFIICVTTILINCCRSVSYSKPIHKVAVDFPLMSYVNQVMSEAQRAGVELDSFHNKVDFVFLLPLHDNLNGIYLPVQRQIIINSKLLLDTIVLKKVIYHEMGHAFGLRHDSTGIMQTHMKDGSVHSEYCPHEGGSPDKWRTHKKEFFDKILSYQNLDFSD